MRPYCKVSQVHFLGVSACVVDATPALSCQTFILLLIYWHQLRLQSCLTVWLSWDVV